MSKKQDRTQPDRYRRLAEYCGIDVRAGWDPENVQHDANRIQEKLRKDGVLITYTYVAFDRNWQCSLQYCIDSSLVGVSYTIAGGKTKMIALAKAADERIRYMKTQKEITDV